MNPGDPGERTEALVDPRAPRFGQAITATLAAAAIALGHPGLAYALAVLLLVPVLSRWRIDPYRWLWRRVMVPVVGRPTEREPAAPHRFARVLGATGVTFASLLFVADLMIAGAVVLAAVGLLAGLAAVTGLCVGCRMYRQVSFLRSRGIV